MGFPATFPAAFPNGTGPGGGDVYDDAYDAVYGGGAEPEPGGGGDSSSSGGGFFDGILRPQIRVYAGFGGTLDPGPGYVHLGIGPGLGTGLLAGPGVGVNEVEVTGDVRAISISLRGAPSDIDAADPVTCQLVLNNFDGVYDPLNPASPYAGQLTDGTPIRVRWIWDGTAYDRFYGELTDIVHEVHNDWDVTATLVAVDALEKLGRAYLPVQGVPVRDGDLTGARVTWLADQAAHPSALRAIDTGYTRLPPTILGASAVELMRQVTNTEFGLLFVDGAGRLRFYGRHHGALEAHSAITQATFGDVAGSVPLRELGVSLTRDRAFNRVAITRDQIPNAEVPVIEGQPEPDPADDDPTEQVADDSTLQALKGILALPAEAGQLSRNDFDALALAQYLLARFKNTQTRISGLEVSTLTTPTTLYATLLGLGPWDRVEVDQGYGPSTITADLLIQGVGPEEITADPPSWSLSFTTSNPPAVPTLFLLGTGQLGSTTTGRLGW